MLPAGGLGKRVGGPLPKQLIAVEGKPLYRYSLETFLSHPKIGEVILVVPAEWRSHFEQDLQQELLVHKDRLWLVDGGAERWQSVRKGVDALGADSEYVLVHDVARPFLSALLIDGVIAALDQGACLVAKPATDTVKVVESGRVRETLDRNCIWLAQTPQACSVQILRDLYARLDIEGSAENLPWHPTDEASILERFGIPVSVVPGNEHNDKVTTAADLQRLRKLE